MVVDTPTFDPETIAATAAVTTFVNTLVQEPLKRAVEALWGRVFGKKPSASIDKRALAWREEGDEIESELAKQQASVKRASDLLHGSSNKGST